MYSQFLTIVSGLQSHNLVSNILERRRSGGSGLSAVAVRTRDSAQDRGGQSRLRPSERPKPPMPKRMRTSSHESSLDEAG